MRDAATRARTREKHNALKRLKNQVDKPTPTAKKEGVRHPTGVRPLLHISTTTDNMLHLKVRAGMVHRNCDRPALNTVTQSRQLRVDLLKPRHELHAFAPQRGNTLRFWRHQPPIISRVMVTQARQLRRQHVTHPQPPRQSPNLGQSRHRRQSHNNPTPRASQDQHSPNPTPTPYRPHPLLTSLSRLHRIKVAHRTNTIHFLNSLHHLNHFPSISRR